MVNGNQTYPLFIIHYIHYYYYYYNATFRTQICKNIYLMTTNANLQLIQYKILHRFHLSGRKLFKMGFTSETCSHCIQNKPDTYVHAIWHCTPIKSAGKTSLNHYPSLWNVTSQCLPPSVYYIITGVISIDLSSWLFLGRFVCLAYFAFVTCT